MLKWEHCAVLGWAGLTSQSPLQSCGCLGREIGDWIGRCESDDFFTLRDFVPLDFILG